MYMSRLAAMKEYAFMKALGQNGFPVPEPISQNRHTIVMSLIDAFPLRQISEVPQPDVLYSELMDMIVRLARFGLIHGDFNEFNLLIKEIEDPDAKEGENPEIIRLEPVLIDFPQMVSVDHPNAEMYFDRDIDCIKRFFQRKFKFVSDVPGPFFKDAKKQLIKNASERLDIQVEASGFSRKMAKELEAYMKEVGANEDDEEPRNEDSEDDNEDEEDSGSEEDEEQTSETRSDEVDDSSRKLGELRVS